MVKASIRNGYMLLLFLIFSIILNEIRMVEQAKKVHESLHLAGY